jgi:hypothetical protein
MRCGLIGPARRYWPGGQRWMRSSDREVRALFGIVFHCYRGRACRHPARVSPAFCGAFTRSYASRALLIHWY